MYDEIKNEIRDLEEQITTIQSRASRRGLAMASGDRKNVHKMEEKIEELQMSLPVNGGPLTLPGANLASSSGPFANFGEQAQAIAKAATPGGQVDSRLYDIRAAATGLGESVPSEGGFLVQQDFSTELLQSSYDAGLISSRVNRMPISASSNGLKLPAVDETSRADGSRWGGIKSYWTNEAALKVKSKPKFRLMELNLKKLIGVSYVTDELLQDSTALDSFLRQAFTDEIAFKTDDAIINGTGAGEPLGILNCAALVSVDKEAAQAADTIMTENIVKMYSRLFASSRNSAVWLINQNVEPQLFTLHLDVGTGGIPVYMPAGGLSGLPYGTLFGRPVLPIEQCQTLGDQGDIILADFANGYVLADKGGIKTDRSIHVKFDYDETVFRFVLRVDGQPVRASALTPYKGGATATQSHFVALDDRA